MLIMKILRQPHTTGQLIRVAYAGAFLVGCLGLALLILLLPSTANPVTSLQIGLAVALLLTALGQTLLMYRVIARQFMPGRIQQTEGELARERALLRTVIDNLPDLIYAKDTEGKFIFVNPANIRVLGGSSFEGVIGKTDFDFHPYDMAVQYRADEERLLQNKVPLINHEEAFIRADGSRWWLSTSKIPVRDDDGSIIGLVGIGHDVTERKRAQEEALLAKDRLLRAVIDSIPDYIFAKDKEGRFLLSNVAHAHAAGITDPDALLGKRAEELFPRDMAAQFTQDDETVILTEQPLLNIERTSVDAQGEKRFVLTTKLPLRNPSGQVIGLVGISRDITQRKQVEAALMESEQRFRRLFEQTNDAVFIMDLDGRQLAANRRASEMLGYTVEEMETMSPDKFTIPEEIPDTQSKLQAVRSGQTLRPYERIFRRKDGSLFPVEINLELIRDDHGMTLHLQGVVRDISERKQAEKALEHERYLLRTLIDGIPDQIYIKDTESRFLVANSAIAQSLGMKQPDDLLGKTDFDIHPSERATDFFDEEQILFKTGIPIVDREEYLLEASGNKICVLINKFPLRNRDGRIIGLIGVNRDITQRKSAEEKLAEERNLLKTLIDNLPAYVFVKDTASRFLIANPPVLHSFNTTNPDDVIGKSDLDLHEAPFAQEAYEDEQGLIRTGASVIDKEEHITLRNGRKVWLLTTKIPLRNTTGQRIGIVGINLDITARKQAEENLAQERHLLRTLIDNIPDHVYVKDLQSRFILANPAAAYYFGLPHPDALLGKTDADFYPQEEAQQYLLEEKGLIASKELVIGREVSTLDRTRHESVWLLVNKLPLLDPDGNILGIVGVNRDITQIKNAQEALRKSEEHYRVISELISDYALSTRIEPDGRLSFEWGIGSITKLVGHPWENFHSIWEEDQQQGVLFSEYHPDDRARVQADFEKTLRGETISGEYRLLTQDDSVMWVRTYRYPIWDEKEKRVVRFYSVGQNINARKKAEEALRLSEERFRAVYEQSPLGIVSDDLHGRFIQVNQRFCEFIGYSADELYQMRVSDVTYPDDRPIGSAEYQKLLRREIPSFSVQKRYVHKDGQVIWGEVSVAPVVNEHMQILSTVAIVADINARKKAEAEVTKRAAELEIVAKVSAIAAAILDGDTLLQRAVHLTQVGFNLYHTQVYLMDEGEKLLVLAAGSGSAGESMKARGHNIPLEHSSSIVAQAARSRDGIIVNDVTTVSNFLSSRFLPDTKSEMAIPMIVGDKLIGVLDVQSEIVDRFTEADLTVKSTLADQIAIAIQNAQAFEALKRSEAETRRVQVFLDSVIENIPDTIFVKDADHLSYLRLNRAGEELLGVPREALIGKSDCDFFPKEVADFLTSKDREVLASGQLLDIPEEDIATQDKGMRVLHTKKIPILNAEGKPQYLLGISEDITERKRAEERQAQLMAELESVNQDLKDFAYIVSHDLKAPLRAINSLADWIVTDYADRFDHEGREMMGLLSSRVSRMNGLIDGVLQYSRLGRTHEQRIPVNVNQIVDSVLELLALPAHIHIEVQKDLPTLMFEPTRIEQIFQNLIGNAIKFMDKPSGKIQVNCASHDQTHWCFSISDNGPGIDQQYFGKIFQIFQTLAPRDEFESTGIGLTIVKRIVELYGGKIWVESVVGQGTTFLFTLPKGNYASSYLNLGQ